MRALLAVLVTAMLSQSAFASDWRYCLAPSHSQHKIYMSPPFPATVSMDDAELQFGRLLSQSGLRFDDVQCPRGRDETAAMTMQQHAITVNRQLGNEIVHLRWTPRS
jgi:hypothetical protein